MSRNFPLIFPLQITSEIKRVIRKKKKSHKKIYWSVSLELQVCAAFVGAAAIFWFILDAGTTSLATAVKQKVVLK